MNELDWVSTNEELLREISPNELALLNKQECANDFKKRKLEAEARKNWERFYNRNLDHFFKDRHWAKRDLEIILDNLNLNEPLEFLEAGCGVGNMLFPIAEYFPHWKLSGFDFSEKAINFVNKRAAKLSLSIQTAVFDLTAETSSKDLNIPKVDILSLIFVLSSISPEKQRDAIRNLKRFMKHGSTLILRDYGIFDYAMLRFGRGAKLCEQFYTRQDGTRAYFFKKEELINMFTEFGFITRRCEYLYKKTVNRKEQSSVDRVFVQARFILSDAS